MEIQRIRCVDGNLLNLRKSRVPGMIGRKKAAKNGVDYHSVNLRFLGESEEGIAYMNVSRFIEKVDEKKREILKKSKLSNAELHMFMAGMNSAMEAFKEGGGDCCGWIPVAERLPEIGDTVLITLWDRDVTIGTWYGYRWGTPLRYDEDVLAWMSLPKPFSQQN